MDELMRVRVLIADDHRMVRAALRSLLEHEPGVEVVGEAGDGRTAVRLAAELFPDVVIMDVSMPDLNGIEATRQIRAGQNGAGPKVIALSGHTDSRYAREMLKAGATGYMMKEAAFQELATALRLVMQNTVYLSPTVAGAVVDVLLRGGEDASSPFSKLSSREREVLQLMAEGKATKEIANRLEISPKTVETHRRNLMEKLELDSLAGLTKYALREGLTSL
jgi:DNA-binding NarL/FixJ family response regulator